MLGLAGALELKGSFLSRPELFTRSLTLATEAVRLRPDNAEAHEQLGDTLMSMGRYDEAVAALREGIRLAPDRASDARIARARVLARQRRCGWCDYGVRSDAAAEPGGWLHASAARDALHAAR